MNLKSIGEEIRKARKERKCTQKQLARQLGINRYTISKIENGCPSAGLRMYHNIAVQLSLEYELKFPVEEISDKESTQ
jgi:HTH-type transcriptional regulator/antitoxin HipB